MRPLPSLPESDYSQVDTPTSKEWANYDYEEDVYSTPETTIYATIEGGRVITVTLHVDIERPREDQPNREEGKHKTPGTLTCAQTTAHPKKSTAAQWYTRRLVVLSLLLVNQRATENKAEKNNRKRNRTIRTKRTVDTLVLILHGT